MGFFDVNLEAGKGRCVVFDERHCVSGVSWLDTFCLLVHVAADCVIDERDGVVVDGPVARSLFLVAERVSDG